MERVDYRTSDFNYKRRELVDELPSDCKQIGSYNDREFNDFYYSVSTDKFYWKYKDSYKVVEPDVQHRVCIKDKNNKTFQFSIYRFRKFLRNE